MNEKGISKENRDALCKDEPWIQRTGCNRADSCHYFTKQAISQFIPGGGWHQHLWKDNISHPMI